LNIFGFTLLRNGVYYDYPFKESLISLSKACSKVYLALGKGDDSTEEEIKSLTFLDVIPTVWDENLRKGGLILSQQTNVALNKLKKDHGSKDDSWGIYIQADEVLNEEYNDQLIEDLQKAQNQGCDAIRFPYLHFWQNYESVCIGKKWYGNEIRAIKLNTKILSSSDAVSFDNVTKIYDSNVPIYHYGHVREQISYQNKVADFHKLYHSNSWKVKKKILKGKITDKFQKTLRFLGTHPEIMKTRIEKSGHTLSKSSKSRDLNFIGTNTFKPHAISSIEASSIKWFEVKSLCKGLSKNTINLTMKNNSIFSKYFLYGSKVPLGMLNPKALNWSKEMWLTFKLSEKGFTQQKP
jgi:hypothetical protein